MIKNYKDLNVWSKGVELADTIYKVTKTFPLDQTYSLANQMQRAAVSIPSNIAEGSTRKTTKELLRYLNIARGSVCELETQLIIANKAGFVESKKVIEISKTCDDIGKMLMGLEKSLNNKANHNLQTTSIKSQTTNHNL